MAKLMKLLVINAHPDDAELTCAATCKQAIDLGWDVYQLFMTSDEYSTKRNDFKGKRIRVIRKCEMEEAAKVYGINSDGTTKIKLIWFGEIDGYLPFNYDVFSRLKKKVLEINPNIVIGPESFFTLDLHPDHKHTGWLIYLVIKSIESSKQPKLLLCNSLNTNFYIRIKSLSMLQKAWAKHTSQATLLGNKLMIPIIKIIFNLRRIKANLKLVEGYRIASFKKGENKIKTIRHKFLYFMVCKIFSGFEKRRYHPSPKELGLI